MNVSQVIDNCIFHSGNLRHYTSYNRKKGRSYRFVELLKGFGIKEQVLVSVVVDVVLVVEVTSSEQSDES